MKKVFATAALLTTLGFHSFASNAKSPVYDKSANPTIGITIENVHNGTTFSIKDKNGSVIKRGKVRNGQTITIETKDLKSGTYYFEILGESKMFVVA
jgi:hypothetical protein